MVTSLRSWEPAACQQQTRGFHAAVVLSACGGSVCGSWGFLSPASSPRTAFPVWYLAEGPVASAVLQSLLGIKT